MKQEIIFQQGIFLIKFFFLKKSTQFLFNQHLCLEEIGIGMMKKKTSRAKSANNI